MSETKWTPGPHYVGVMNDALFILTQPPSPSGTDVSPDTPHPNQKVLAKVDSPDVSFEENQANATLYAHAPELYESLVAMTVTAAPLEYWKEARAKARAALAKARGE